MASKTKENPLLFSANISSPFDEISSSTLLIPPQQPPKPPECSSEETEAADGLSKSLQPHLEKSSTPASSFPLVPTSKPPSAGSQANQGIATPPLPPSINSQGGSFLRKPTNKYVVPPEISAVSSLPVPSPSSSPRSPLFASPQSLRPSVTTFTPLPGYESSTLTNDYSLPTSEGPPVAQFAADLSSTIANHPPQHTTKTTVIPASFDVMADSPPVHGELYHPVIPHWFFSEGKPLIWKPFSFTDSLNLEEAYRKGSPEKVATDGGRYDVFVLERKRLPLYWEGESGSVRRCSWFRRTYSEAYPLPYSEEVAERLEAEYKDAMLTSQWHRQVELPGGERVMLNSPFSMHHYHVQESADMPNITSLSESQYPQTVKRGADDFEIKEGASHKVDHLLFLIHGIGSACDLSFRPVEDCVNDFRSMGEDLLATHFKESIESGQVGRVEILPISWHKALHGDATGLDEKLKLITLRSIPKFREFINDTLLDVLFYTSPVYCQHIMDIVATEMERLLTLFRERNTNFAGSISVGGHSLGSVILLDLLMHQNPSKEQEKQSEDDDTKDKTVSAANGEKESVNGDQRGSLTSQINFMMGAAGTGQPAIVYPQLSFHPEAFFLMGSPVGMFITVRGIDTLGPSFKLPTCGRVFNIFHPFDPVAYRLETLIDTSFVELRPVLIPHHKGRKRMHLELKDTIERVGADLKNKIVDSIHSTWNKFCHMYAGNHYEQAEMEQAVEERMRAVNEESGGEGQEDHDNVGQLNRGLRVDYVLQEKPYESFTEYIFALQAHVSYWNSEDTLLMILRELYKINGISSDIQPLNQQQTRPPSSPEALISTYSEEKPVSHPILGQKPTVPSVPVPMFSTPASPSAQLAPPPSMKNELPGTLRGRPRFDPTNAPTNTAGMDPTASPSGSEHQTKPPILPIMKFNRKKT